MRIELRCPECPCRLCADADTPAEQVIERMIDDGPWFALARGETFEHMVLAALRARGAIRCPDCGRPVAVVGGNGGQLSRGQRLSA
jgi:hypothetical protein